MSSTGEPKGSWNRQIPGVQWESEKPTEDDYLSDIARRFGEADKQLREADLSENWASGGRKFKSSNDPEKIVRDLIVIRDTVKKLAAVQGAPPETLVNIAGISHLGHGMASFIDPTNFKGPQIFLDRGMYNLCLSDEVLDVYAGVGIHEIGHIKYTREMFQQMRQDLVKGLKEIWWNLLEDDRIERKEIEESPGFAKYIQAFKRVLYGRQEAGVAIKKWTYLPEKDKIFEIVFSALRMPYQLTNEMKSWITLTGHCPYLELKSALKTVPEREREIKAYVNIIGDLYEKWIGDKQQTAETILKKEKNAKKQVEMQGNMGGSQGSPAEGGGDGTSGEPSPSESGKGEASSGSGEGESGTGGETSVTENSGKTEGEKDGSNATSGGDLGTGESKGNAKQDESPSPEEIEAKKKEMEKRNKQQKEFDEEDATAEKLLNMLEADKQKLTDRAEESTEGGRNSRPKEEFATKADSDVQKIVDKIGKILKDRRTEGRFGERELKELVKRVEAVGAGMSAGETLEYQKVEAERTIVGPSWSFGDEVPREVVISHPQVTPKIEDEYKAVKKEVEGHIGAMRHVFKFRFGRKEFVESERKTGKLHGRQLGKSQISDRLFTSKYEKVAEGVALGLLLDSSGSMGGPMSGGSREYKIDIVKKVAILIAEAVKLQPQVELEIYSHTTGGGVGVYSYGGGSDCYIKVLYGKKNKKLEAIGSLRQAGSNYDHVAVREAGRMLIENTVNKKKVLIVLSDGQPAGYNYGGPAAEEAVRQEVRKLEKKSVKVISVAIEDYACEQMYKNNIKFLNFETLIKDMRNLILRIIREAGHTQT